MIYRTRSQRHRALAEAQAALSRTEGRLDEVQATWPRVIEHVVAQVTGAGKLGDQGR